jgi:hypothetical protein
MSVRLDDPNIVDMMITGEGWVLGRPEGVTEDTPVFTFIDRQQLPDDICAYCGGKASTKDHVVPQCFWGEWPLPPNVPKVPACQRCNNYWSRHEGYARSVIAITERSKHPVAVQMCKSGSVKYHLEKDAAFRREYMHSQLNLAEQFAGEGIFTGFKKLLHVNTARTTAVIGKIARGLYFFETGKIVPDECKVRSCLMSELPPGEKTRDMVECLLPASASYGFSDTIFQLRRMPTRLSDSDLPVRGYEFSFYTGVQMYVGIAPNLDGDDYSHQSEVALGIKEKKLINLARKNNIALPPFTVPLYNIPLVRKSRE